MLTHFGRMDYHPRQTLPERFDTAVVLCLTHINGRLQAWGSVCRLFCIQRLPNGLAITHLWKREAWHPAASSIGLLLFLFSCCTNIAFLGLLTWEQSAWIYCGCNAVFPWKGDLHSRCDESVRASWPPPFLLIITLCILKLCWRLFTT